MFCGTPGTGIHAKRLFGFAMWDLLAAIAASMLINQLFFHKEHLMRALFYVFFAGFVVHGVLGIDTKLNRIIMKIPNALLR